MRAYYYGRREGSVERERKGRRKGGKGRRKEREDSLRLNSAASGLTPAADCTNSRVPAYLL